MKGDGLALILTHPNGMYGRGTSLNSNIMSRPWNCQEVQNICDDKAATSAVHLDPDQKPTDKSISVQHNYSICRLARAHAAMSSQAHFFLLLLFFFFKPHLRITITVWEMKGRTVNTRPDEPHSGDLQFY